MTPTALIAWVLSLLIYLDPKSAYREDFPRIAEAIAIESTASPVFEGRSGAWKTAALEVAIARYESNFQIDATGDCKPKDTTKFGTCKPGARGSSFGLYQISRSNFRTLEVTEEEMTTDPVLQTRASLRMVRNSLRICRARPLEERLAQYAAGGEGCSESLDATTKSRHRMLTGMMLFRSHPPPIRSEAP